MSLVIWIAAAGAAIVITALNDGGLARVKKTIGRPKASTLNRTLSFGITCLRSATPAAVVVRLKQSHLKRLASSLQGFIKRRRIPARSSITMIRHQFGWKISNAGSSAIERGWGTQHT